MRGNEVDVLSSETSKKSTSEYDAMYHVRLIHEWSPAKMSPSLDISAVSSFYGLQLELHGSHNDQQDSKLLQNDTQSVSTSISVLLNFELPPSSTLLESLEKMTGPFDVIVRSKIPISNVNEDVQAAIQQMSIVQIENILVGINGDHLFDDPKATGADIYRRLVIVASRASLASPFELTMRRHDLALISSKIVPFAQRKDVQEAQMAQLAKLAAQDAALPSAIRFKKLFLIQQLDYEREHYLVPHVGLPLQKLHASLMDTCQWQIYEFSKTSWYFHAPTLRLCAEHPFRSHPEAQELIRRVQEQFQLAVRKLQRKTRSHQRRKRFLSIMQSEKRQLETKQSEQKLHSVVLRIQRRFRAFRCRKQIFAIIQDGKRRKEEQQQQQNEEREAEKRQLEQMELEQQRMKQEEEMRKLEQIQMEQQEREEKKQQLETIKLDQQRLQQEREEEIRQLEKIKLEQHRLQQEREEEKRKIEQFQMEQQERDEKKQQMEKVEMELQRLQQEREEDRQELKKMKLEQLRLQQEEDEEKQQLDKIKVEQQQLQEERGVEMQQLEKIKLEQQRLQQRLQQERKKDIWQLDQIKLEQQRLQQEREEEKQRLEEIKQWQQRLQQRLQQERDEEKQQLDQIKVEQQRLHQGRDEEKQQLEQIKVEQQRLQQGRDEEKRLLEQIKVEQLRLQQGREEEAQRLENIKLEQRRLQQVLDEVSVDFKRVKFSETASGCLENSFFDVKEEQRRLQERLIRLEIDVENHSKKKCYKENETQTSARQGYNEEQDSKMPKLAELVQKSICCDRLNDNVRGQVAETGNDVEWQNYLTLIKESIKNKRHLPDKNRCTQYASGSDEKFSTASSRVQMPRNPFFYASDEWRQCFPWQQSKNFDNIGNDSKLFTLKGNPNKSDIMPPQFRTLESFFAPGPRMETPPSSVGQPWRKSGALPFTSSQTILEAAHNRYGQHQYSGPIRTMGNDISCAQNLTKTNTTAKLPYIIRRY